MTNPSLTLIDSVRSAGRVARTRYAGLPFRGRALLCATGAAALALAVDLAAIRPIEAKHAEVRAQLDGARLAVTQQQKALHALGMKRPEREIEALQHAINLQRTAARHGAARVRERLGSFVGPDETESLLTDLLRDHPGLALVAAEVTPGEPVQLDAPASATGSAAARGGEGDVSVPTTRSVANTAAAANTGSGLFRHGVRLELEGSYLEALAYLRALEAMPWGLGWDSVEFQTLSFPKGRLVVEVHTISDRPDWLGGAR